jgi:uncharacterized protein YlxW (UPF0749 family)
MIALNIMSKTNIFSTASNPANMEEETFKRFARVILKKENLDTLRRAIRDGEFNVNQTDKEGFTLTHVAAKTGNRKAVAMLLQVDTIKPHMKNNDGYTPLAEACRFKKMGTLEELLKSNKVNSNVVDDNYNTAENFVNVFVDAGQEMKDEMLQLIQESRSAAGPVDVTGRHLLLVINTAYTPESTWAPLEGDKVQFGPKKDGEVLTKMFEENHYKVHTVRDAENVLQAVREKMELIPRPELKLMQFIYSGGWMIIS